MTDQITKLIDLDIKYLQSSIQLTETDVKLIRAMMERCYVSGTIDGADTISDITNRTIERVLKATEE